MDRIEVVSAMPDDALAIAEVHVAAWQAGYRGLVPDEVLAGLSVERREIYWRDALIVGSPMVFVARVGDELAGWVAVGPCRDTGAPVDAGELWAIYLREAYWGSGTGRALWHRARQWLVGQGMRSASLWVLAETHELSASIVQPGSSQSRPVPGITPLAEDP